MALHDIPFCDGFDAKSCPTLATPWTVAFQAPLSMGFSRQEYWSGLPFLLQRIFPTQGLNQGLLHFKQILYWLSYKGSPLYPSNLSKISSHSYLKHKNKLLSITRGHLKHFHKCYLHMKKSPTSVHVGGRWQESEDNMNFFLKTFSFMDLFSCPRLRQAASLAEACRIFSFHMFPDQGSNPSPLALGAQNLSPWITRKSQCEFLYILSGRSS